VYTNGVVMYSGWVRWFGLCSRSWRRRTRCQTSTPELFV